MQNYKNLNLISQNLDFFFNNLATKEAKSSGFITRNRKISGSNFLKAVCFSNIANPNSTLENMCQILADDAVDITKQGFDQKFNNNSKEFFARMFRHSLKLFQNNLPINTNLIKSFNRINLLDSSHIKLPNFMKDIYKGCGGGFENREKNHSTVKIQLLFDYLNSSISRIDLKEGIRSDQGYKDYLKNVRKGDLFIFDLGYFVPNAFASIASQNAYFITRYKSDTNFYISKTSKQKLDLTKCLNENNKILKNTLYLGLQTRLPVRVIYQKYL